jgi:hypothetical protein
VSGTARRSSPQSARSSTKHAGRSRREIRGAFDRLERHRRAFSNPLLAEERDAMWIQALVKASRFDEARARGEVFRKRYPDSLFSSAVDSALESVP